MTNAGSGRRGPADRQQLLRRALVDLREARARIATVERSHTEPLAVVGMGCRFPGSASPEEYWTLLHQGRDAITEVPPDRWDADAYFDPNPSFPGKTYTRHGGFIGEVGQFDAHFFGIPPREAISMDPQHRIVLEVAWEALENSSIAPDRLRGSATGVFMGLTSTDYAYSGMKLGDPARIDAYAGTGNAPNFASGRLSYLLGLCGPSMVVDTACSSSLVTVHLACQSLRSGECDLALAGGVSLMLLPETTIALSKAQMLAADGRCKTFDASADGYVRGEGCGIVVLKRLSDAMADGDDIVAVIRGSAVNQDGRSSGLTVPYGAAQEAVVRSALAAAKVAPAEVAYVEAHGTGTPLGDPIEVRALGRVLSPGRPGDRPLLLGSAKTNIGHLEAAAGIAGLIKVVLAIRHGEIPAHLHVEKLNPHVPWDELPVRVVTARSPWPDGPKVAGISSFGISGTNAHVVLAEPPAVEVPDLPPGPESARTPQPVRLSARGEQALRELAGRMAGWVRAHPDVSLPAVAAAANLGRAELPDRLAVAADSAEELAGRFEAMAVGRPAPGSAVGHVQAGRVPVVAFLYTGQGTPYAGMGRELYRAEPVFRSALDACAATLGKAGPDLLFSLLDPSASASPADTAKAQPATFALGVALTQLWRSWGVEPGWVLGHSLGEYIAAWAAGVLSLEDGMRVVAERGRLMDSLPPGGCMVAVSAPHDRVAAASSHQTGVTVAAVNGPASTVISGRAERVEAVVRELADDGIRTTYLDVSHAFHSAEVEPVLSELAQLLDGVPLSAPSLGMVTNLTGQPAGTEVTTGDYWRRQAREPVRFAAGLATLHKRGCRVFVEIGAGAGLLGLARQAIPDDTAAFLPSLRPGRGAALQMLESLAECWVRGVKVDWGGVVGPGPRPRLTLPTYPFQRRRYWIPERAAEPETAAETRLAPRRVPTPLRQILVETKVGAGRVPFVAEHRVYGHVVVPGVVYLELLLTAAAEAGLSDAVVEDMALVHPVVLADGDVRTLQVVAEPQEDGSLRAKVCGLAAQHEAGDGAWHTHVSAVVRPSTPEEGVAVSIDALRRRCPDELDGDRFYRSIWHPEFDLGPSFRLIEHVCRGDREALALVRAPEPGSQAVRDGIRPDLLVLDACVQGLIAAAPDSAENGKVPVGIGHERVRRYGSASIGPVWCHAVVRDAAGGGINGNIRLLDEAGRPVIEVEGVRFGPVGRETLRHLGSPRSGSADASPAAGRRVSSTHMRNQLRAATPAERRKLAVGYLTGEVASVIGLAPSEVDRTEPITSIADSLMLAELKARIEGDLGIEVPLTALFDQPTVDDFAAWLTSSLDHGPTGRDEVPAGPGVMTVERMLAEAVLEPELAPSNPSAAQRVLGAGSRAVPTAVLLTGATGFVGAFLLAEILGRTGADVYCLVRAETADQGRRRIIDNARSYLLDLTQAGQRIRPIPGDLALPLFGLEAAAFGELAGKLDAIYHCGAVVKWTYPFEALRPANIAGTREVLRLACRGGAVPVHFVSTVGVFSSADYKGDAVSEREELERSGALPVGYAQTKWVAERMVRTAGERGLPVSVYRPNIGPHSRTGAFNRHDHICLTLKGCIQLGAAPELEVPVQIAPIDFAAAALVELSLGPRLLGGTYHLVNPAPVSWTELFAQVRDLGYPLESVPYDVWETELLARAGTDRTHALAGLLPLFSESVIETARLPVFECSHTMQKLQGAGLACPPIDKMLLEACFSRFTATGFLEPVGTPLAAAERWTGPLHAR